MAKIAIIGAGEIGLALGKIFTHADHAVFYWDKDEDRLRRHPTLSLPEVLDNAEFVFMCVPSWCLREALVFCGHYFSRNSIVVAMSKGLDENTGQTVDELLKKVLPKGQAYAVLGGPMIAQEISDSGFGAGVVGAKNNSLAEKVKSLFTKTDIFVTITNDIRGVAVMNTLKNIYSLAMGIFTGLKLNYNERGYLFGQSLLEINKLNQILGGKKAIFNNPAMLGDFWATSNSSDSLNHKVGLEIAKYGSAGGKSEGLVSVPILLKILGKKAKTFPILLMLEKITMFKADPKEVIADWHKLN